MSKSQLDMNEDNHDWLYQLSSGNNGSIYDVIARHHVKKGELLLAAGATTVINAPDFNESDSVKLKVYFDTEYRKVEFIRRTDGFLRDRTINGTWHTDVDIDIDLAATLSAGHIVMNIVNSGNDDVAIKYLLKIL